MRVSSSLPGPRCISLLDISSNISQVKQIHAQIITNSLSASDLNLAKLVAAYFSVPNASVEANLIYNRNAETHLTHTHVLRACALSAAKANGEQVHARAIKSGHFAHIAVSAAAILFYSKCEDIASARHVFGEMPLRNSVTWNTMLNTYSDNGFYSKSLALFSIMRRDEISVTDRTAVIVVSACSHVGDLCLGRSIHGVMYKLVPFDCFIGTGLVDMYAKCGSLECAYKQFEEMPVRNVLTWTALVSGLAMHGRGKDALDFMNRMTHEGIFPNAVTFTCLLSACCHAGLLEEGVMIFKEMKGRFGVEPGMRHYGCLVDLLGRAGLVEDAKKVLDEMPIEPDTVVLRALLSACKVHGRTELGEAIGKKLMELGEDGNCEDFVALSNVYASAARWEDAMRVRKVMRGVGLRNKAGCSEVHSV